MCGRFYFVMDESKEGKYIKKLCEQFSIYQFEQGEIFPSQDVLALIRDQEKCKPKVFKWGLELKNNLLINARSETIEEKVTFKRILNHRCVIPCNGFYEWKKSGSKKHKYMIRKKEEDIIYLAGLYDDKNLVILTGESENDMKAIHHRTPILLNHSDMQKYLNHTLGAYVDNEDLSIFEADLHHQMSMFEE